MLLLYLFNSDQHSLLNMNSFLRNGARRVSGRQVRWNSKAAGVPQQSNSGLVMFAAGGLFSAAAMYVVGSGDDAPDAQQRKQITDLQAQLKKQQAGGSGQQRVLKDLSEEYLQCTKGSEALTGEMEEMAKRMKNTQEHVMESQKTMDLITKENARYLEALTDRIQHQAETSTNSSVAFVTEKGELVQFKLSGSDINVNVSGQSAGTLQKNVTYDDSNGTIKLPKATVQIPQDRRQILVTNLASMADRAGMSHNLVGVCCYLFFGEAFFKINSRKPLEKNK